MCIRDRVSINESYGKSTYAWDGSKSENKTGEWNRYYENGQLHITGYYDDNKQTGPWQYFGEKGNIILKGSFKNGARIGEWIAYYNNGNPLLKGKYQQDVINGVSIPKSIGTVSYTHLAVYKRQEYKWLLLNFCFHCCENNSQCPVGFKKNVRFR